jgi:putative membrane protein
MTADVARFRPHAAAAWLACTVVALQIAYPLVHGPTRQHLIVAIVLLLAVTSVVHALLTRGVWAALALCLVTALPGFAVEVLGVHTGVPFGSYAYTSLLGPRLFGVPPLVGLAWTMLAWPATVAARHLVRGYWPRVAAGAWALAAADLFLDPQLVAAGAWRWSHATPHLPGVATVPLTNYAGWLAVALVLSAALQAIAGDGDDRVPIALYLWLYAGWTVALAVFLQLPAAAGWGALAMGAVAIPLAVRCAR